MNVREKQCLDNIFSLFPHPQGTERKEACNFIIINLLLKPFN